jgi:hypothetical protein
VLAVKAGSGGATFVQATDTFVVLGGGGGAWAFEFGGPSVSSAGKWTMVAAYGGAGLAGVSGAMGGAALSTDQSTLVLAGGRTLSVLS